MTCREFAALLRTVPGHARRVALLIGLEGGRALLGHAAPARLFADIVSSQRPEDVRPQRIRIQWSGFDQVQRGVLLQQHLRAEAPDAQAIADLVALFRHGYIHAVLLSDPQRALADALSDSQIPCRVFNCAAHRAAVLHEFTSELGQAIVLVDGADVILEGLEPSYTGLEGTELLDMRQALRQFSQAFDLLICWGWCNYNIHLGRIWENRPQMLYALGAYTDCMSLSQSYPYTVVEDPTAASQATTAILREIVSQLLPSEVVSPVLKADTAGSAGIPSGVDCTGAHIFLSYTRADEAQVTAIYHRLTAAGFTPWMDTRDLLPGEMWEQSIPRIIRQADFVLVCLSKNAVNKRGFLQREIKQALDQWQEKLEHDIYLIPVLLESCEVPDALRRFHWADLADAAGWGRLVEALHAGLARKIA